MNNTITEMKNTLEGISSRITEAEERISELEDRMVEITAEEQKKERRMKEKEGTENIRQIHCLLLVLICLKYQKF